VQVLQDGLLVRRLPVRQVRVRQVRVRRLLVRQDELLVRQVRVRRLLVRQDELLVRVRRLLVRQDELLVRQRLVRQDELLVRQRQVRQLRPVGLQVLAPERLQREEQQWRHRIQQQRWQVSRSCRASRVRSCRSSRPVRNCHCASCRWTVRLRRWQGLPLRTALPLCSVFSYFSSVRQKPQRRCEVLEAPGDHHLKHAMYCAIGRRGFKRRDDGRMQDFASFDPMCCLFTTTSCA
jgi:hypothetical protein